MLAAVAAAACLVFAVLGIRALRGPVPASIHVVDRMPVGGQPSDATMGFGYLWVADYNGSVIQVDPVRHRVVRRIAVGGNPYSIAAGAGAIWVTPNEDPANVARLVRLDPRTGRITARLPLDTGSGVVAAGSRTVWLMANSDHPVGSSRLDRIDPATGRTTATVPLPIFGDAIELAGASLWTLTPHGELTQRDPDSGRALRQVVLAASTDRGENVLAADVSGVWVLRPGALVRVDAGGKVARRLPVPAGTLPVLARDGDALWIAQASGFPPRYSVLRLAPDTGATTRTVDLGSHEPRALVPAGGGLWVVGADGTALLVR
jgi:hypothetical protein